MKELILYPFYHFSKKDIFNIEDVIDLINKEDLFQIYDIDEYKYFNEELGYFVYIKGNNIKRKKRIILEFHISKEKIL